MSPTFLRDYFPARALAKSILLVLFLASGPLIWRLVTALVVAAIIWRC